MQTQLTLCVALIFADVCFLLESSLFAVMPVDFSYSSARTFIIVTWKHVLFMTKLSSYLCFAIDHVSSNFHTKIAHVWSNGKFLKHSIYNGDKVDFLKFQLNITWDWHKHIRQNKRILKCNFDVENQIKHYLFVIKHWIVFLLKWWSTCTILETRCIQFSQLSTTYYSALLLWWHSTHILHHIQPWLRVAWQRSI